jgi:glucosamine-phosphate N-acetyltransferase
LHQLSPPDTKEKKGSSLYKKTFLNITQNNDYYIYVASIEEKIVATATLLVQMNLSHACKPYGHIENVVTDKKFRGQGIGNAIVHQLISEAQKRGCYKVILNCAPRTIYFYKQCGFYETEEVEMRIDLPSSLY